MSEGSITTKNLNDPKTFHVKHCPQNRVFKRRSPVGVSLIPVKCGAVSRSKNFLQKKQKSVFFSGCLNNFRR